MASGLKSVYPTECTPLVGKGRARLPSCCQVHS